MPSSGLKVSVVNTVYSPQTLPKIKSGVIFVMMSNGHEEPIYTLRC